MGKIEELQAWMKELGISEEEIVEKFVLGSGPGGQKVNKTSSCVYLKHLPTGIEVKCQQQRSRELNRFLARRELCMQIEELIKGKESKRQKEIEKIRRQKRKRSKRSQEKMLQDKREHSLKKTLRQPPSSLS